RTGTARRSADDRPCDHRRGARRRAARDRGERRREHRHRPRRADRGGGRGGAFRYRRGDVMTAGASADAPLIYLVAGEPSGDVLGGRLMAALRQARPEVTFAGVGGPRMSEHGLSSLVPMHELTVIGFLEAVPRLVRLRSLLRQIADDVLARRPAVLITIDS